MNHQTLHKVDSDIASPAQPYPNGAHSHKGPQILLLDDQDGDHESRKETSTDSSNNGQPVTPILRNSMWEILSLALAAASILALIAILRTHDSKPSPEWSLGPFGVTLNAIVSIVSTVFRASLLMPVAQSISQFGWIWYTQPRPFRDICYYDSASRGPLGSIRLLYRLHFV